MAPRFGTPKFEKGTIFRKGKINKMREMALDISSIILICDMLIYFFIIYCTLLDKLNEIWYYRVLVEWSRAVGYTTSVTDPTMEQSKQIFFVMRPWFAMYSHVVNSMVSLPDCFIESLARVQPRPLIVYLSDCPLSGFISRALTLYIRYDLKRCYLGQLSGHPILMLLKSASGISSNY